MFLKSVWLPVQSGGFCFDWDIDTTALFIPLPVSESEGNDLPPEAHDPPAEEE